MLRNFFGNLREDRAHVKLRKLERREFLGVVYVGRGIMSRADYVFFRKEATAKMKRDIKADREARRARKGQTQFL
jgi:hypothetical protein